MHGRILDVEGRPVAGAEVYLHNTPNVKKPADFISNRTSADGSYRLAVPPGTYWAVAIHRLQGGRFGPLGPDDRHSGEPVELVVSQQQGVEHDFTVVDLREAAWRIQKRNQDLVRVRGRIVDQDGKPLPMAYVLAHPRQQFTELPDYLSAWSDSRGEYTLYLPRGHYFFGAQVGFPPGNDYHLKSGQDIEQDVTGLEIAVEK